MSTEKTKQPHEHPQATRGPVSINEPKAAEATAVVDDGPVSINEPPGSQVLPSPEPEQKKATEHDTGKHEEEDDQHGHASRHGGGGRSPRR